MSDAKRYYWLKLPETFFDAVDDETISFIEDMDGGQAYVLFYLKLLCKALRTDGYLIRYVGTGCIPYDDAALAKLTRMPVDTVRCAVQVLTKVGLMQRLESGELFLTQIKEFTGSETDKARIMRKSRARAELDSKEGNNVTPLLPDSYPDVTQSKSKSKSKEKELKSKTKSKEKELCSELKNTSEPEAPPLADVEALILNTGQEWRPTIAEFEDYKRLYPGVDVAQAFRNMAGWCKGNQTKRKTIKGIRRFVNNWLSGDQDNATRPARQQARPREKPRFNQMETHNYDFNELEKALTQPEGGASE